MKLNSHSGSQSSRSGSNISHSGVLNSNPVPSESSIRSQSLVVGGTNNWVKGAIDAGHTSIKSVPPASSSGGHGNHMQSHTSLVNRAQTSPAMLGSESASSWQQSTSRVLTAPKLSRSGHATVQPRPPLHHMRPHSTDPSLSSLTRVQEEEVLGNMDLESVSISSGLVMNALPYATTTEPNMHRHLTGHVTGHVTSQDRASLSSVQSVSHILEESTFEQSMHFPPDTVSLASGLTSSSSDMFSPAHHATAQDDRGLVGRATGGHMTERATGGAQRRMSFSLPVGSEEEMERANLRLTQTSSVPSSLPKSELEVT